MIFFKFYEILRCCRAKNDQTILNCQKALSAAQSVSRGHHFEAKTTIVAALSYQIKTS